MKRLTGYGRGSSDPHIVFNIRLCTGWSKSIRSPDDYNTEGRCTETFWSPFIYLYILLLLLLFICIWDVHSTLNQLTKQKSYLCTGWSKSVCSPDDHNTEGRCTETFWSPFIYPYILLLLFICIWDVHSTLNQLTKQKSYLCTGRSKRIRSPDDYNTEGRCTEIFWSTFIYLYISLLLFICIWDVHSTLNQLSKKKSYLCTGCSKSICLPDDYNTDDRCTETFWSPFIYLYMLLLLLICIWDVHSTLNQLSKQKSHYHNRKQP